MCGVVGVFGVDLAAVATYFGLHHLQHRGQDSAGITTVDAQGLHTIKNHGTVSEAIPADRFCELTGRTAIGQIRYPTVGSTTLDEAQPLVLVNTDTGEQVAVAHNGQLNGHGGWQQSLSDTERVLSTYARARGDSLEDRVLTTLSRVADYGSYALVMVFSDPEKGPTLVVARDRYGNRPLTMGRIGGGYGFASETAALRGIQTLGMYDKITYDRDVAPGEVIFLSERDGFKSVSGDDLPPALRPREYLPCFFELVYFSRPDSMVYGSQVSKARYNIGKALAREHPVDGDVVLAIPDSANDIARGYARASGIPQLPGILRSHYSGRSFIEAADILPVEALGTHRSFAISRKFGFNPDIIEGQRLIVVDDSLVRGLTSTRIVRALFEMGAAEVHLRIGSPPTTHSCFYGVETSQRDELVAATHPDKEAIRHSLGSVVDGRMRLPDSLEYLSFAGTMAATGLPPGSGCNACVTGNYVVPRGTS